MTEDDFWNRVLAVGLTDPEGRQRWTNSFPTLADVGASDLSAWTARLRETGLVTELQLSAFSADPPQSLQFGPYVLESAEPVSPCQWMMPARRIRDDQRGWLARVERRSRQLNFRVGEL